MRWTVVGLHTAGELLHVEASSLQRLKAVMVLAAAAAAAGGHEGAFKSQMKQTDCETLFICTRINVTFIGR